MPRSKPLWLFTWEHASNSISLDNGISEENLLPSHFFFDSITNRETGFCICGVFTIKNISIIKLQELSAYLPSTSIRIHDLFYNLEHVVSSQPLTTCFPLQSSLVIGVMNFIPKLLLRNSYGQASFLIVLSFFFGTYDGL